MKKVVIASPLRTAIGSFAGNLSTLSAVDLGANVIREIAARNNLQSDRIDEILMGNVLQAGSGQNPARQSAINAGIDVVVPASTINTVCGSGLHAVGIAYNSILAGSSNVIISGGMESMSNAPHYIKSMRNGLKLSNGEIIDSILGDGLTCPFNKYHMGITAENVASEYNISRQEQDEYAYLSQMRASKALSEGVFKDEIISIAIKKKKEEIQFCEDEYIRPDTTIEKLSSLRPAFKNDGTVTAGNSSGINDGAAAMLVMDEDSAKSQGISPFAYIKGFSIVGLRPEIMGMGPVYSIRKLLKNEDMDIKNVDLFELNEAFASQSVACRKELGIDIEKVNVNGGAIALGHPIGASGARILVTLVHQLKRQGKRYGIASLCVGTGMGVAILVENATI